MSHKPVFDAPLRTMHLRDALRAMEQLGPTNQPIPARIGHFTHNRKSGRGGDYIEIPEAVLLTEAAQANPRSMRARAADKERKATASGVKHRPGAHFRNSTRDLLLPTGDKHRFIIYTLVMFNGYRVVL